MTAALNDITTTILKRLTDAATDEANAIEDAHAADASAKLAALTIPKAYDAAITQVAQRTAAAEKALRAYRDASEALNAAQATRVSLDIAYQHERDALVVLAHAPHRVSVASARLSAAIDTWQNDWKSSRNPWRGKAALAALFAAQNALGHALCGITAPIRDVIGFVEHAIADAQKAAADAAEPRVATGTNRAPFYVPRR